MGRSTAGFSSAGFYMALITVSYINGGKEMINDKFTDVEQRVMENWHNGSEIKDDVNYDDPSSINIKFFRGLMKETAYHEAGHLVARMFTGLEFSHVQLVSIIPDKVTNGQMRCERPFTELYLEQVPMAQMQRSQGYSLLLELFAGYGSVMVIEQSECETLWEYFYEELYIDEEYYEDGSDLCRADRIAGILSRPHFSKDRILGMTAGWTLEMLKMPAVWNAVETIAEILISKGEITNENIEIFSDLRRTLNVPMVMKMPKWSRRIYGK